MPDQLESKEKPSEGAPTVEEPKPLDQRQKDALATFFNRTLDTPDKNAIKIRPAQTKSGEEPGPPKEDEKSKAPKTQKSSDDPAPKAGSKPSVEEEEPPPPAPSYADLVAAAGEGAAKVLVQQQEQQRSSGQSSAQAPKLPAEIQRKLSVLETMEKLYPDRYRGVADKWKAGVMAAGEYEAQWKRDNPGKSFDRDDPEHEAFLEDHAVTWDDMDFQEAMIEQRAEAKAAKMREEIRKEMEREIAPLQQRVRAEDMRDAITKAADSGSSIFLKTLAELEDSPFKALVDTEGSLVDSEAEKLDAVAKDVILEYYAKNRIPALNQKLFKLLNDLDSFNPNDQDHVKLRDIVLDTELRLKALPPQQQRSRDGREFATWEEMEKIPQKDRGRYWSLTYADVQLLLGEDAAKNALNHYKDQKERFDRYMAASGGKQETPASPKERETVPQIRPSLPQFSRNLPENEDTHGGKPVSPAGGVAPKLAPASSKNASGSETPNQTFMRRFIK